MPGKPYFLPCLGRRRRQLIPSCLIGIVGVPFQACASCSSFPNPVNETSARLVAGGVVVQGVAFLVDPAVVGARSAGLRLPGEGAQWPSIQPARAARHPRDHAAHRHRAPVRSRPTEAIRARHRPALQWRRAAGLGLGSACGVVRPHQRTDRRGNPGVGVRHLPRLHRVQPADAVGSDPRNPCARSATTSAASSPRPIRELRRQRAD